MDRKYLVAVVMLAFFAIMFGLIGTVAPNMESAQPQQSSPSGSSSLTHFAYPPSFDSGWVDIRDKTGQYFNITHNLDSTEIVVDITGKQSLSGNSGEHQRNFGTDANAGWTKTYGGTNADQASSLVQTADGGYAIAGSSRSFGTTWCSYLIKADWTGTMLWQQVFGGGGDNYALSLVQTADGGYAIAGYTNSYGSGMHDAWVIKTDRSGNMLWSNTYGGSKNDYAYSLIQTSDRGYAVAGCTYSYGVGGGDYWLVKTDSLGNKLWNRTYGGASLDEAHSLVQTLDGGYAIAGFTRSSGAGGGDFLLVKTSPTGTMLWNKTYGGTNDDYAYSLVKTSDEGYAIAGNTASFGAVEQDFWLVQTDSAGKELWSKRYGGSDFDYAYSLVQAIDGGYALAGSAYALGAGGIDFWLVKTDSMGNMRWNQTYGGTSDDVAYSLVQTRDGGFALAGYTSSFGAGSGDFWLVKTNVETGLAWTGTSLTDVTLYRGLTDPYWNYVRIRVWIIQEPTWQYGDINQDGVVDVKDLYIVSRNYGKTFSLLSLTGIVFIVGIQGYRTNKKPRTTEK